MHRPLPATAMVAFCLAASVSAFAEENPSERARALLGRDDAKAAVAVLEEALGSADPAKIPSLVEDLRQAYDKAARKAESEGNRREAERYRENFRLLNRKSKPAKTEEVVASPKPEPAPQPVPKVDPAPVKPKDEAAPVVVEPQEVPQPRPDAVPSDLARADKAWKAKKYYDAGAIYGELARQGNLPPERNDHWAYCRLVKVLEVINTGPTSPAQWAQIHAEIDRIRVLSPKNWYGEYLRNVAVERSGAGKRPASNKTILRGAQPDEKPSKRKSKPTSSAGAMKPAEPAAAEETGTGQPGPVVGSWQTFDTPNFRILHQDEALARQVAAKAEAARTQFTAFWSGSKTRVRWAPRCDLYLYPTASQFAEETRQSAESPGFSTSELSGGRVTQRVIRLRADHAKMIEAVLPHEITHVVLADLFPVRQIPRWADEGMAVLSEPIAEQGLRASDLAGPLASGNVFDMTTLMTTDYPADPLRAMFYAESISVTRYLVSQGTPPQFVAFVKESQTLGIEPALRKSYGIKGFADLDRRWRSFAQEKVAETASNDVIRK